MRPARRALAPTLIISDGCNGLNPLTIRRCRRMWASHELDEPLDPERTVFQFVRKREAIALEAFPQLTAEEARLLALETAGMVASEVREAAARFVATGERPGRLYRHGQVSVHPTQEMVMEALLNPLRVRSELRQLGFKVRLRGHWGGASGRQSLRIANRVLGALTPVTIFTARALRYAATKPV
jgi:hypothetical protein